MEAIPVLLGPITIFCVYRLSCGHLSPSEKTQSLEQNHNHQNDQPDGQRADKERNHREHESDVGKLQKKIDHQESVIG